MRSTWEKYVKGRNMVWCIIGNRDKIDMTALESFGPITEYKGKDIIR